MNTNVGVAKPEQLPPFMPELELSRACYEEAVRPIVERQAVGSRPSARSERFKYRITGYV